MDDDNTPCLCQHRAVEHDTHGFCRACQCDDFRSDDTALAAAAGVLTQAPTGGAA